MVTLYSPLHPFKPIWSPVYSERTVKPHCSLHYIVVALDDTPQFGNVSVTQRIVFPAFSHPLILWSRHLTPASRRHWTFLLPWQQQKSYQIELGFCVWSQCESLGVFGHLFNVFFFQTHVIFINFLLYSLRWNNYLMDCWFEINS